MRPLFAGLDLGTSSLKGVVVDASGELAASAQVAYPMRRPLPGRAEQSPADWLGAAHAVLKQLSERTSAVGWEAIGLSGMLPTLVTLDASGDPVGPAVTWEDTRAEAQGSKLRAMVGSEDLYRLTGQWVDGRYLLPVVMWLTQHEPERLTPTGQIRGAKDYLFQHLTGEWGTDPSTAAGYGCFELASGAWNAEIANAAGVFLNQLPPVRPSAASAPIRSEIGRELGLPEGLRVCVGAADSVLGAVGLGVTTPGQIAYVAGSSTVILGVADRILLDASHRYLVTPMASDGTWGLEMDLLSTGSAMQWLADTIALADGVPGLLELAEGSPAGAGGVTFLPYMGSGEQGALWDPSLRGSVFGVTLGHTGKDFARALLEGIAIESRRCVDVLRAAGIAPNEMRVSGVGAESRLFRRMLADATGLRLEVATGRAAMGSAIGAAMLAAGSAGAASAFEPTEADPASAELWDGLAVRHDRYRVMISGLEG